jgi:hypothetical protein
MMASMRLYIFRAGKAWAGSRFHRDEKGIALALAIAAMLVLTLVLTSVIFLTSSSARDAHRTNAGQKAYNLAQAGISSALAVLNSNYPASVFPGPSNLLSSAGCPCTSQYATGSVVWNGSLNPAPATAEWRYEWDLTATGSVKNPTGPSANITRKVTAVVPVVIPDTTSIDPSQSTLNWIYGRGITFGQSVIVKSPVFATGDLTLAGTATIGETIPADAAGNPARPNKVNVTGNVLQNNVGSNQNHIGHVDTTTDPAGQLERVYVGGQCKIGNGSLHACTFNSTAGGADWIFRQSATQSTVDAPSFSCCTGVAGLTYANPVTQTTPPGNVVPFWYQNANLGPNTPCYVYYSTGTIPSPLTFDRQGVAQTAVGADNVLDQSATAGRPAFDLTPASAAYDCESQNGQHQLGWNGTNAVFHGIQPGHLKVWGTIFIDGSVTSTANPAIYEGIGALIMTGTFLMSNQQELCVAVTGSNCDTSFAWDPNKAGLFIFAGGDFTTDRSLQQTNANGSGVSIEMKKAQYQGGLFARGIIDASVTGTVVDGPMISAYTDVFAGQSGILTFPPLLFPTSGSSGFSGPLPLARLLTPRQFGGG